MCLVFESEKPPNLSSTSSTATVSQGARRIGLFNEDLTVGQIPNFLGGGGRQGEHVEMLYCSVFDKNKRPDPSSTSSTLMGSQGGCCIQIFAEHLSRGRILTFLGGRGYSQQPNHT